MSPAMRIGRVAFLKLLRGCCSLPGNGCNQRPTRKTLSRKLSSNSGGEITASKAARCFTPPCAPLLLILSVATDAARDASAFAEAEPAMESQFEWEAETQSALAAAVGSLPHDQREVLVLKIWNELTFSEIAGALGISQNTAASRYRYALANLKKSLQPQ